MSFLDNLDNNLKALESREEHGYGRGRDRDRAKRDHERDLARATAPYAEQLRKGAFTSELLNEATRIGYGLRTKVHITWLDCRLRLEAREHRVELKPTAEGIVAEYWVSGEVTGKETVDLNGNARKFAERWLAGVAPKPKLASVE